MNKSHIITGNMNKKQVEQYLKEAIELQEYFNSGKKNVFLEAQAKKHFERFPKKLYKYVKLNRFTFDSIKNNYVYLCPADKLDDQFECLARDPSLEEYEKYENDNAITSKVIEMLPEQLKQFPMPLNKEQIIYLVNQCSQDGAFDMNKAISLVQEETGYHLTPAEMDTLKVFSDIRFDKLGESIAEKTFSLYSRLKEDTGIGSLTEKNRSQVMWEMYANHYKGVCIEYDLSNNDNALRNTFPVKYSSKREINLIENIMGLSLASVFSMITGGKTIGTDNIRTLVETILTKYKEWSFQKEWRIVDTPNTKFKVPKIKKIYVGKNISNKDLKKLCEIAIEKDIQLYGQYDDTDELQIKYIKIDKYHFAKLNH